MTSSEIVTIISALAVALVSVITAWRSGAKVEVMQQKAEHSAEVAGEKLDAIHELTNSNLTAVKAALAKADERIVKLEGMLEAAVTAPHGKGVAK